MNKITLQEWADKWRESIYTKPSVHVYCDIVINRDAHIELFHLSDYVVSTVSGPVRWMRKIGDE